jgi:vancomycin resistance protein VanJ
VEDMAVSRPPRRLVTIRRRGADGLAVMPGALIVMAIAAAAFPPRDGAPAMAMAFEQWLFLAPIAVLTPIAVWRRARVLLASILACALVGGCLFGSEWISLPGGAASRHDLAVMSWNVRAGERTPATQAAQLEGLDVDLIALQEVEPDAAAAIEGDPTLALRYPYRAIAPSWGTWGLAILSRYPISDVVHREHPAVLDLVVTTPRGVVRVVDVHLSPPDLYGDSAIPLAYDTGVRTSELAAIQGLSDAAREAGERLLVLGDFNTTPSEAGYALLTRGLRDTHVEVGEGPGWTWRPSRLTFLPLAFLRIDLQLSAGAIRPASTSVDCQYQGDHCRLFGSYEID